MGTKTAIRTTQSIVPTANLNVIMYSKNSFLAIFQIIRTPHCFILYSISRGKILFLLLRRPKQETISVPWLCCLCRLSAHGVALACPEPLHSEPQRHA